MVSSAKRLHWRVVSRRLFSKESLVRFLTAPGDRFLASGARLWLRLKNFMRKCLRKRLDFSRLNPNLKPRKFFKILQNFKVMLLTSYSYLLSFVPFGIRISSMKALHWRVLGRWFRSSACEPFNRRNRRIEDMRFEMCHWTIKFSTSCTPWVACIIALGSS